MENKKIDFDNIEVKTDIDLESSCRICLLTHSELILIFDKKNNFNGIPIVNMINECSPYKAIRFDDYPQHICLKCVENVKIAFSFRKQCEESYSIISAYLNGGTEPSITDSKVIPQWDKSTQTEGTAIYPCEKCDDKFYTFDALRIHRLHYHRGTKNECRVCKKPFRRVGLLKGHYAMYHPELGYNEDNICTICGKVFERKATLFRHMEKVHKATQDIPKSLDLDTFQDFDNKEKKSTEKSNEENISEIKDIKLDVLNIKELDHKQIIKKRQPRLKRKQKDPSPSESDESSQENHIKNKKSKRNKIRESTDDEIPISKLKKRKGGPRNKTKKEKNGKINKAKDTDKTDNLNITSEEEKSKTIAETPEEKIKKELDSDPDFDFTINNIFADSSDDDDKDSIDRQIQGLSKTKEKEQNQNKINEILLPEDIQLKTDGTENPDGLSENTLQIGELEGFNAHLKIRTCTVCLKVFRFPHHLKRHMLARHSSEKKFKCTICSSAFATPDYLKIHMKRCPVNRSTPRSRIKKYKCEGCEERFSSSRALNNHVRTTHPTLFKKVFTCSYCTTSFETRHECTVHTNTVHENDKEYLCTQCGQRFVRNRALEIHMRRHRGEKNHKCKFCGKGFVRAGDKDLHEKYHTGDKRFKCEICGQGFVRNYSLRVHMRIHTGEKPYHCESCPRTFAQSNDLKTHVRRDHTGERFVCDIDACGESFLQLYLLNRHKKNIHNVFAHSHISRVKKIYDVSEFSEISENNANIQETVN